MRIHCNFLRAQLTLWKQLLTANYRAILSMYCCLYWDCVACNYWYSGCNSSKKRETVNVHRGEEVWTAPAHCPVMGVWDIIPGN